jgi:hypothetical protein
LVEQYRRELSAIPRTISGTYASVGLTRDHTKRKRAQCKIQCELLRPRNFPSTTTFNDNHAKQIKMAATKERSGLAVGLNKGHVR